ncbi:MULTISPECIES: chemotaxis protein CheA [unclassified Arsukibacterium]|uniref:chemotaxis protein CheA n=1 Tax=unclassified Arsukibacterium TaxID=2635278 RepID=UPI000C91CEB3|nr:MULTISPECIES: chemotaxis protein CheA [unclassified Arsukibacterium]MAA95391.1 chemotaxis protein CheA [Rheinheimera sp.]HAW93105.1 chemotaxis protein CheA [Candidatus Azambacteria bacterium]|tara:strand:+ start:21387 stop:23609 length:2223 start_codon:yes stop_codon:yes gene_type:complete
MSFDMDEDILQDFLVEAGEILELLQEQLVELENNPDDANLLNAIFRGFHTVKGGAGFLSLTELVDACHGAENVFDILRTGKRRVTPELMDVILQTLDAINAMFVEVQARQPLTPANPAVLDALHHYSEPEKAGEAAPVIAQAEPEVPATAAAGHDDTAAEGDIDDISEAEFERMLDQLHGKGAPGRADAAPAVTQPASESSDITDDEFEAILDQLHGKGSFVPDTNKAAGTATPSQPAVSKQAAASQTGKSSATPSASDDEISDDEFEALLDQLHGKGNAPVETPAAPERKPAPTAAAKPAAPPSTSAAAPAAKAPVAASAVAAPAAADKAAAANAAPAAETTVRVDTKRLDQIMNMVGELVLVRNRLVSLSTSTQDEEMTKAISNLDVVTADIQGAVMKTRMQPIKKVFGRFPRVVRDLARSLQKDINLILEGEETDLDKNLVEALADPLVHLVRNSVDHGIEMPDVRLKAGKPKVGLVKLAATQAGDHILLTIQDDGAGMDPEKLKGIAIKRGILDADAAARMSDNDAFNLIFAPGFSTKEQISDISGRGVGMDVVKTKINQLNGTVQINSKLGVGTLLEIKVPLTLAILPTLMVMVGKQTFALPLAGVNEIFHLNLAKTNIVDGQLTIVVRNKALPLFYLEHWLVKGSNKQLRREQGHVVIVQIGTQQVGFVVDSLIGQEEVVIKPLDALLQGTPGMAGATITSDGGIALILDVPNLLKHYAKKSKIKFDRFNKLNA